ncbi:MAG: hypothetical protein ACKOX3_05645 [Bacteroidota bacterium]
MMRLNRLIKIVPLVLFLFFSISSNAQSSRTKAIRNADKVKVEQEKKQEKAIKEGIKNHRKLQSKKVRKHMKRNDHRYQHSDAYDNRPNWLKRMFPKKRPSAN